MTSEETERSKSTAKPIQQVHNNNEEAFSEPSYAYPVRATIIRQPSDVRNRNTPNQIQAETNINDEDIIEPSTSNHVRAASMRRASKDTSRTPPNNLQLMCNGVEEVAIQPSLVNIVKQPVMRRPSEESSSIKSPSESFYEPSDSSSVHSVNPNENDYRPSRRGSRNEGRGVLKSVQKQEMAMSDQTRHLRVATPKQICWADDPTEGLVSRSYSQMSPTGSFSTSTRSFSMRAKVHPKDMLDCTRGVQQKVQTQYSVGNFKMNPPPTSISMINETSKIWFQPQFTRNEANQSLLRKSSGAFVVRKSTSKKDAFDLAIKVEKLPKYSNEHDVGDPNNLIRHFLIETSRLGVRLMGSDTEPYFSSLTALIYQHCLTPLSLPCLLRIEAILSNEDNISNTMNETELPSPTLSSLTSVSVPSPNPLFHPFINGTNSFSRKTDVSSHNMNSPTLKGSFFYLASINVENMSGWAALDKTISSILQQIGNVRQTECSLWIDMDGVTLTDKWRKLFFRQHFPASSIAYCEMDRRGRTWNSPELTSRGVTNANIFGVIIRMKPQGSPSHNQCIVMCECSPEQPAKPFMDAMFKMILAQS